MGTNIKIKEIFNKDQRKAIVFLEILSYKEREEVIASFRKPVPEGEN